ncbi:hypothetical protein DUNSADRAFT_2391 [Dunaliella salina]|uniref:Transmembrane protein 218 n=1 Tax=Dunaliella salina TaxID=3046 RepID=A0ABQ7GVT1_DUNSA|nr:hypothetical protein DUNSADRAFT_2391 [Dunaliella salina]|eukprot:KAF5838695.1 hypothetical protein DUNSADRAFT_2391 [Dunaliella salina]
MHEGQLGFRNVDHGSPVGPGSKEIPKQQQQEDFQDRIPWPAVEDDSIIDDKHGRHLLSSYRVAGVGVGIFVFFLFLAFCVLLCVVGSRTRFPWVIFSVSTAILVIVVLALFASPRGEAPEPPETGYDQTIGGLITVMVLLCVGILLAGLGMVGLVATEQHFAWPLSYHMDIDQHY